jgi:hypothetical protein
MDSKQMLVQMYDGRYKHMSDHEITYIESLHKKIIYANRPPDGNDEVNIKKMYKIFITRSFR